MGKFFKKILYLAWVPLFVCCVNYSVDPANLYRDKKNEVTIARFLAQGKNVAYNTVIDQNLILRYYQNLLSGSKDVIVLGSSRVMTIDSELFPGKSFFNNAVPIGSLKDFLAIYWRYRNKSLLPQTVIIGLDPWILNEHNNRFENKSIFSDYEEALRAFSFKTYEKKGYLNRNSILRKYYELFSPSYFQVSCSLFWKGLTVKDRGQCNFYPTNDFSGKDQIIHSDGSVSFFAKTRDRSIQEVRQIILEFRDERNSLSYLEGFRKIDPLNSELFEKFVSMLKNDGINVVFLLVPYHPQAYEILSTYPKYTIVKKVQEYFEAFSRQKGIPLIGSYNPIDCDLEESDFFDEMHPRKEALERYLKNNLRFNNAVLKEGNVL